MSTPTILGAWALASFVVFLLLLWVRQMVLLIRDGKRRSGGDGR